MKFSERKEVLEEIEIQKELKQSYLRKYIFKFAILALALIIGVTSRGKKTDFPTPSSDDIAMAGALATIEGRESAIDKTYGGAKITRERTYGKDIISVFEVDDMYSFCVFESIDEGYWMEYCGKLFPKTALVKGTVLLGDNSHEYDLYLQYDNTYSRLTVTRTYRKYQKYKETENIHFDENGIGIAKIDYNPRHFFKPQIIAYDSEGKEYLLDDGGIF